MRKYKIDLAAELNKRRFVVGILLSLLMAVINPRVGATKGPLKPEYTVDYGVVSLIFLLSGLRLGTKELCQASHKKALLCFVQLYSFLAILFIVQSLNVIFRMMNVNSWILRGVTTVACMPPTVVSGVVLTERASGDEASAVLSAALGSVLGVFLTPLLLLYTSGSTTIAPLARSMLRLLVTVLLPLLMGCVLTVPFTRLFGVRQKSAGVCSQAALLLMLYTSFCDALLEHNMHFDLAQDVIISVLLVLVVLSVTTWVAWLAASFLLPPPDVSAAIFCSTHKSLTFGLPLLHVVYSSRLDGHAALLALPLLIQQPAQAMMGAMLAPLLHTTNKHQLPV